MSAAAEVRAAGRGGFTLTEMLVAMVLGAVILAGAYGVMVDQDRAYRHLGAMAATQQDARMGLALLTAELRELSGAGSDLVMATPDSVRFRALRKFGILCDKSANDKKLTVAQVGVDPFSGGDSVLVFVDRDTLLARDDGWVAEYVQSVGSSSLCGTTLGLSLGLLMPDSELRVLQLQGNGVKFDSVFTGAPVRSFDVLTYATADVDGERLAVRWQNGQLAPLFGPVTDPDGLVLRYFDGDGIELTAFPLTAADRARVHRVQVELRVERERGPPLGAYVDSLITDIYLRGG